MAVITATTITWFFKLWPGQYLQAYLWTPPVWVILPSLCHCSSLTYANVPVMPYTLFHFPFKTLIEYLLVGDAMPDIFQTQPMHSYPPVNIDATLDLCVCVNEKIAVLPFGEWEDVHTQNFWNYFLVLDTLVTLSMLKCTVLLRGWHSPTVTVSPIWMSLSGRIGEQAYSHGTSQHNYTWTCSADSLGRWQWFSDCSFCSPCQTESSPKWRCYQWREISCQSRCPQCPFLMSWSPDQCSCITAGASPCQCLSAGIFLFWKMVVCFG